MTGILTKWEFMLIREGLKELLERHNIMTSIPALKEIIKKIEIKILD